MGVRIYPILKEGVTTAEFLGLPKEAQLDYDSHMKYQPCISDFVAYSDWADAFTDDAQAINSFELNGWGKFYPCEWQMDGQYVSSNGSERDKSKWENVFLTNGERFGIEREERVNIIKGKPNFTDKMDGVYWV